MVQNNSNLVRGYSRAVFAIAKEYNIQEYFYWFLALLNQALKHPAMKKTINNGSINYIDKANLLISMTNNYISSIKTYPNKNYNEAISQQMLDIMQTRGTNFINLLAKKRHLSLINNIYEQYDKLFLNHENKLRVTIISAIILDPTQKESLQNNLTKYFNKDLWLDFKVDNSIIAGILIKYNDEVLDYSLKGKLLGLKQILKNN